LSEISIFADESGEAGAESQYYLLTLVLHEQDSDISRQLELYRASLATKNLPDIPLHASPLMNGHGDYENMDIQERKLLLQSFFVMLQHLPYRYRTFAYDKREFAGEEDLSVRMKRDVVNFMFENLAYLQRFDQVKIYYDNGQSVVTRALHDAAEYALAKDAVIYRVGSPKDYCLSQAADLICTLELTALKFDSGEQTSTDDRFFGTYGSFKKNYLKKIRRKRI
jgi:hypothetical protein